MAEKSTMKGKRVTNALRVTKTTLRNALMTRLKEERGRTDLQYTAAPEVAASAMADVPIEQRAGYPVKRATGSVDPKDWVTKGGKKVMVDFGRYAWLPDEWGQGVKTTEPTAHSTGGTGGTYTVIIAPDGMVFYHRGPAEEHWGKPFSLEAGFNGQVKLAHLQAQQAVQLARRQIKESSPGAMAQVLIGTDTDASLFKILASHERRLVAPKEEFHFAVISARRATNLSGIKDIWMVQSQLLEAGVTPTWYVDEASLKDYKALGLMAVTGGKLTAARNKALKDAKSKGKVCVQLSDDISAWEYRHGENARERTDEAQNEAHAAARRFIVSPVAAAQFILAKLRGAPEAKKPKLGGVYMLGSCARTFSGEAFSRKHFILGDFFVVDVGSSIRFDEEMKLKEDYDFTCAHIKTHGSVMRCNRMTLNVKHYNNGGGACTNRDKYGLEEKRSVDILNKKWPGCFRANPKRRGEVILSWKASAAGDWSEEDAHDDDVLADSGTTTGKNTKKRTTVAKRPALACAAHASRIGVKRAIAKKPSMA